MLAVHPDTHHECNNGCACERRTDLKNDIGNESDEAGRQRIQGARVDQHLGEGDAAKNQRKADQ
ncbi:MAG: hypothetical protein AAF869_04425 [Pseudomonadota bacterium]